MPTSTSAKKTLSRLAVSTVSPPSPYANPAKPQPVSLPGPSWLHVPVRIRPTSPSTLLQDRSSIPPHSRTFSSKSNSRPPYRPAWVRCVTFGASGMSLLFSSSGMQHKFRPTFRFLEVKHFVWCELSQTLYFTHRRILLKILSSLVFRHYQLLPSSFVPKSPRVLIYSSGSLPSLKRSINFCPFRLSLYKNEILHSNSVFISRFEAKKYFCPHNPTFFLPPRGTQTANNEYQQHSRPNQSNSTVQQFKLFFKKNTVSRFPLYAPVFRDIYHR